MWVERALADLPLVAGQRAEDLPRRRVVHKPFAVGLQPNRQHTTINIDAGEDTATLRRASKVSNYIQPSQASQRKRESVRQRQRDRESKREREKEEPGPGEVETVAPNQGKIARRAAGASSISGGARCMITYRDCADHVAGKAEAHVEHLVLVVPQRRQALPARRAPHLARFIHRALQQASAAGHGIPIFRRGVRGRPARLPCWLVANIRGSKSGGHQKRTAAANKGKGKGRTVTTRVPAWLNSQLEISPRCPTSLCTCSGQGE